MIKLCDIEIYKLLYIIFVSCMEEEIFRLLWKIVNVVPAYNKGVLKIMIQFHFFQLLVKYLNVYPITKYTLSLLKIN